MKHRSGTLAFGFTLIEMAFVVVIAGIILVPVMSAMTSFLKAGQLSATQTNLQSLLRATAAYVQANGCLPCPAPANASPSNFGKIGTMDGAACGTCRTAGTSGPDGIPPYIALGLDPSVAKDGWGRWITMHIDPELAKSGVVPPAASCAGAQVNILPGCVTTDAGKNGICRASLPKQLAVNIANSASSPAAVVFVSHGANGYGAYYARQGANCAAWRYGFPSNARPCVGGKESETCNDECKTPDNNFFLMDRGDNFDDVIVYADRNALVSYLGTGACGTTW
ncbi:MAG: type II secretion system protein [Alphaproteobacteria bacterium]